MSRLGGAIASNPQELVRALHIDQGHLSHRLWPLERPRFLVIGRSTGEAAVLCPHIYSTDLDGLICKICFSSLVRDA